MVGGRRQVLRRLRQLRQQVGWGGTARCVAQALLRRCGRWQNLPVEARNYQYWIGFFEKRHRFFHIRDKWLLPAGERPLFSIFMMLDDTPESWLSYTLEAVQAQSFPAWELLVLGKPAVIPRLAQMAERYAANDLRIKTLWVPTANMLEQAQGRYVVWLGQGDALASNALICIAKEIHAYPESVLIYSDEDQINQDGCRCDPYFKPDWNPDLFHSQNIVRWGGVFNLEMIRTLDLRDAQSVDDLTYDLALHITERVVPVRIRHVPQVLYHRRLRSNVPVKEEARSAGVQVVGRHFERLGIEVYVTVDPASSGVCRVRYALPATLPSVTLVVLTRDRVDLLRRCISSILEKTCYSDYRILVVDNGSTESGALEYLREIAQRSNVAVMRDDSEFNFAALNNRAVASAESRVVGLLNNDLEVINSDWLKEMVSHAMRPEIGVVGARLWYPDDTLQHAGVFLAGDLVAMHLHKGLPRGNSGHGDRAMTIQNFSAVTGACMLMRKDVYMGVGGMEERLTVAYNDVDLCLRVAQAGYRILWTPYAELYHHESASRGREDTQQKLSRLKLESDFMKERWGAALFNDPAYNPNLSLEGEDCGLAWPPRARQN